MAPESRIPLSLVTLCKRKFLVEDLNNNLTQELRSLRSHVTQLEFRNARSQVAYDRIHNQQDRQISGLHDQLQAKTNLIKSLQSYCDWWAQKWSVSNNDRQKLLHDNYVLRLHVQALESRLEKRNIRSSLRSRNVDSNESSAMIVE